MKHLLFATFILCIAAAIASAAPPPDTIIVINTGSSTSVGNNLINETQTWPAMAKRCEQYAGVLVKNPFLLREPMQFDQHRMLRELVADKPNDAKLQARADGEAFSRAWANRTAKQWFGVYLGSPGRTFPVKPGETAKQWAQRAYDALKVYRDCCPDALAFDATQGDAKRDTPQSKIVDGPGAGEHQLMKMLRADGIEVIIEPSTYTDVPRYHDFGVYYTQVWLDNTRYRGLTRKDNGRTYRDPKLATHRYREVRRGELSDEDYLATIKKVIDEGDHALVFIGGLPESMK